MPRVSAAPVCSLKTRKLRHDAIAWLRSHKPLSAGRLFPPKPLFFPAEFARRIKQTLELYPTLRKPVGFQSFSRLEIPAISIRSITCRGPRPGQFRSFICR
jgi:hypothetical protein